MVQGERRRLWIFRMTHIDNVPFILRNGLWSKLSGEREAGTPDGTPGTGNEREAGKASQGPSESEEASAQPVPRHDPAFKAIGNAEIIGRRTQKRVVVVPPGGVLGEYVPFYFSGHSPMLLNIATGYGVPRIPQRDIVFLVCDAFEIAAQGIPFCFTDGNATKSISRFYNSFDDLDKLDWSTIRSTFWTNTDDDYDRVRKKMAEFLVKGHVPASLIRGIIVRDEAAARKLSAMLDGAALPIKTDTNNDYFYQQYD